MRDVTRYYLSATYPDGRKVDAGPYAVLNDAIGAGRCLKRGRGAIVLVFDNAGRYFDTAGRRAR